MTREEAIECLSERVSIGGTGEQNCMVVFGVNTDTLDEAFDMAISALRQQETVTNRNGLNEPLTMDELLEMDGEPVWVEFQDGSGGCWGLVHITVFTHIVFANGLFCTVGKPYFGKTWLAYRQKPEEDDHDERKENKNA